MASFAGAIKPSRNAKWMIRRPQYVCDLIIRHDILEREKRSSMRNTQKLSITLPHDMAAMVKAKVASGEYVTESEVIRDGLRAPLARDAAVESWLRDEVAKSNDAYEADPKSGSPADEVMARVGFLPGACG